MFSSAQTRPTAAQRVQASKRASGRVWLTSLEFMTNSVAMCPSDFCWYHGQRNHRHNQEFLWPKAGKILWFLDGSCLPKESTWVGFLQLRNRQAGENKLLFLLLGWLLYNSLTPPNFVSGSEVLAWSSRIITTGCYLIQETASFLFWGPFRTEIFEIVLKNPMTESLKFKKHTPPDPKMQFLVLGNTL